jgi:hypothetical protein
MTAKVACRNGKALAGKDLGGRRVASAMFHEAVDHQHLGAGLIVRLPAAPEESPAIVNCNEIFEQGTIPGVASQLEAA